MEIKIKALSTDDSTDTFNAVSELFYDMYEFMSKKGLNLKLSENGKYLWIKSIRGLLGKLNMVYMAIINDEIIGFCAGNIRLSPAFLGNKKIGYISHVYVKQKYRKNKVGVILVNHIEQWFKEKKVDFIELEVLNQNASAIKFWSSLNYSIDYIKMIKNDKIS